MIERVLNMKFNDLEKNKFRFTIKDIKADIEDSDIAAAMDSIIEKDVFISKGGRLESKSEAQIVTKESTDIVL